MKEKIDDVVILPKGTIINLNGFEAKLIKDTKVLSPAIKEYGLKNAKECDSFPTLKGIKGRPMIINPIELLSRNY